MSTKSLNFLFSLALALAFLGCSKPESDNIQTINPLLGDISFVKRFGHYPASTTDEDLRIKTHLEFVENHLRKKDVSHFPEALRKKRVRVLDLLREYHSAGIFPRNYDHSDRRVPCFIDKNGRICAVGYLIEQTAGRQAAEDINNSFKYHEVLAMNSSQVEDWVTGSGLTKEECAMIQPTYGPYPSYSTNRITAAYGISSSILSGLNLSLTAINGIQFARGTENKGAAVTGVITGIGQMILGTAMFPQQNNYWTGAYGDGGQKTLSMINIGLGTTTAALSVWRLASNRPEKASSMSWNIYGIPAPGNRIGLGFSLTRKL